MMNWEIGIDIYTLICIKWITDKNLLYKKINKIIKFRKKINVASMMSAGLRGSCENHEFLVGHRSPSQPINEETHQHTLIRL